MKERCLECQHATAFHIDLEGNPQPCDVEIPVEGRHAPEFCGCTYQVERAKNLALAMPQINQLPQRVRKNFPDDEERYAN